MIDDDLIERGFLY